MSKVKRWMDNNPDWTLLISYIIAIGLLLLTSVDTQQ